MKTKMLAGLGAGIVSATLITAFAQQSSPYLGSRFSSVWNTVKDRPYNDQRPTYEVTLGSFFSGLTDKLKAAALRTINDRSDVLPEFTKLLHANGICFSGTWNITEANPYSGYFKEGSQAQIIVRASAALSEVNQGQKRAFGIAGKLFPTNDPNDSRLLKTANFFTVDNLGGTYIPNFRDTVLTNDTSDVDFGVANIGSAGVALAAVRALTAADKATGGNNPKVRQVYQIAELGESDLSRVVTPQWFKLQGRPGQRVNFKDFRDELSLENNGGELVFDIYVTSKGEQGKEKIDWQKIGYISLIEDALSMGCDHRLHFNHPVWRNDLRFQ